MLQKKITVFTDSVPQIFSSEDGTLEELERVLSSNVLIQSIKQGILSKITPSITQVLVKIDALNLRFNSKEELAGFILKEILHYEQYKGEIIPRVIHHCWVGKSLSHTAMGNLYLWMEQTQKYNWKHLLWTDSAVNSKFEDTVLPMQFGLLSQGNIQIMDLASTVLEMEEEVQTAYGILVQQTESKKYAPLPYMSDLIRYSCLFHYGGIYIDVDINPGNVCLISSLKHRSSDSDIPLLGPCFRTQRDAKISGYYNCLRGNREAALLKMYNRNIIGNHFIATHAQNHVMKKTAGYAAQKIMATGYKTDGPSDLVHTIVKNTVSTDNPNIGTILAESIPPWLLDINWVSDESDKLVN